MVHRNYVNDLHGLEKVSRVLRLLSKRCFALILNYSRQIRYIR
jgi:hypothetical protein